MKILLQNGQAQTVDDFYGARLVEQGRAVLIPQGKDQKPKRKKAGVKNVAGNKNCGR